MDYVDWGFEYIWIISEDESGGGITASSLRTWASQQSYHPIRSPLLLDPGWTLAGRKYGFAAGTPQTVLVGRDMVIREQYEGFGSTFQNNVPNSIKTLVKE